MNNIVDMFTDLENITTLAVSTTLVYGAAYLGRSYLLINPSQAALFSLGTWIVGNLGRRLISSNLGFSVPCRMLSTACLYIPAQIAIVNKVFSVPQTLMLLGLTSLVSNIYCSVIGNSPLYLK